MPTLKATLSNLSHSPKLPEILLDANRIVLADPNYAMHEILTAAATGGWTERSGALAATVLVGEPYLLGKSLHPVLPAPLPNKVSDFIISSPPLSQLIIRLKPRQDECWDLGETPGIEIDLVKFKITISGPIPSQTRLKSLVDGWLSPEGAQE